MLNTHENNKKAKKMWEELHRQYDITEEMCMSHEYDYLDKDDEEGDEEYKNALKEREVYECYIDRLSMDSCTEDLTPEEIEQLKKEGRI